MSRSERFDALVQELLDGRTPDLSAVERDTRLDEAQRRALRILAASRWRGASPLERAPVELGAALGAGASGRVHRARDPLLERAVAVKVLGAGAFASSSQRARFLAEARALASVEHENVVRIHGVHEHAGEVRLELELVEGRTLDELVREEGPLGAEEAARIGIELCHALAAIHARGLVHCDLKPANVMRERGGRIVVLDFGVARGSGPPGEEAWTAGAGTPLFMSPEQFRGERDLHLSSDLFALGCMLYWLVCGVAPFTGENYDALRTNVLAGRHVPLLDRRPDLRGGLAAIVERALAPDAASRFRSAGEMERELRALLSAAAPATRGSNVRSRVLALSAGAALLAAIVAFLWIARAGRQRTAPDFECRLLVQRGSNEIALRSAERVRVGDHLRLELRLEEDAHVYVFDEDERGSLFALFPLPGFEPANPLPAHVRHVLPGVRGGESRAWVVTSAGGEETVLVAVSREPIAELEALRTTAGIPADLATGSAAFRVGESSRADVLRGLGATDARNADATDSSGSRRLGELGERMPFDDGSAVRVRLLRVRSE